MTVIESLIVETPDTAAAEAFYTALVGPDGPVAVRSSDAPSSGFRGFTLSLIASQPDNVDALYDAAIASGGTPLKPAKKSLWGYGGLVTAPDGTILNIATSTKKNTGPAAREFDKIVLLIGAEDVGASKQFYVDHGLTVGKSFGRKYVEFTSEKEHIQLGLYTRRALAKTAGVSPDGSGSHRIAIGSDAGPFTDPDGFAWESA
ncbi:VOC family protein [Cryptosporangium aurantiacum]|uniref:Glyoxalase-like domain-containing protein n=1 Tax=Cryptosporangium aurantiacum TaxID=134849 RepID=A0A1M7RJL9_9ACTN|nr:glyoxalase [Cryptosporangium aurantiacum]SHN46503.1 hypothetical protein SAMN05443668_11639 [Cryptosporangium aurantiacum]